MRRWLWAWAEVLLAIPIVLATAVHPLIVDTLTGRPSPDLRLIFAAGCRDRAAFDSALSAGASVSARDRQGNTPLAVAALAGDARMVERLIELGADVNAADVRGFTPLMYAAIRDHVQIMRMLLDAGGDPTRVTLFSHQTALDLANLNDANLIGD